MQFSRVVLSNNLRCLESLNQGNVWEFGLWKNSILKDLFWKKEILIADLAFSVKISET